MRHNDLVTLAGKWLKRTIRCSVILTELHTWNSSREIPDAIGFKHDFSVLVECKTSKQDFKNDSKKPFKRIGNGTGNYRFYLCEPEIITKEELPDGWGLLWYIDKKIVQIKGFRDNCRMNDEVKRFAPDLNSERALLVSKIRRLTNPTKQESEKC